jgi:hypothetical protein
VPNVNVTDRKMQAAARQLQVPVIRLRAATALAAAVIAALPCVVSGTAMASTATAGIRLVPDTTGASAWYIPSAPVIATVPGCGKGANVRKVVATYKAKKYLAAGYRTDTLYCGTTRVYGYRHLEEHVAEYFGGWPSFTFAMAQTLKAPARVVVQDNGNYLESAPIYQCFYAGYYIIWTFFVVPEISSGTIVTAYGREGRRVNQSCP